MADVVVAIKKLRGLLSVQEVTVALGWGYAFFRAKQPPAYIHNSIAAVRVMYVQSSCCVHKINSYSTFSMLSSSFLLKLPNEMTSIEKKN